MFPCEFLLVYFKNHDAATNMLRRGLQLRQQALRQRSILLHHPRRHASVFSDLHQLPQPGEKLHGFTARRAKAIPELKLATVEMQHDQTGANYLHISREDKNNVFSIGFKTNPDDDTGVPHILEHTALCGSSKYPVRDPFFKMLNRSLSNFMNAFTSADHTSYPFATTNHADFYNLMDVYMDATLAPLLKECDFKQEGWRIGPSDLSDPNSPLVFKGVVYNEMKGQMSDSSYLFYIRFQDHIFPSIHNSGGDPQKITDLTVDQLRNFHKKHYNASNSKIITYGDIPLQEHLQKLNEKLSNFGVSNVDKEIRVPLSLNGPQHVTVSGPVDPLMDKDAQHKTSLSWIMNDTSDVVETLGLKILGDYLLDGYGSPMYQGLIDEKLGSDFSPNTGFDTSAKKAIFSIGLQNVRLEDVAKVHDTIRNVLQDVRQKGFDQKKVEGSLHQLELSLKHKTANFGISLVQNLMPGWFNAVDPFDTLAWENTITKFKNLYNQGGYLESLMDKYLLTDNTFTFTMTPEKGYGNQLAGEEEKRLTKEIEKIGEEKTAREKVTQQELELLEVQDRARNEDLSCLPTVKIQDIPRSMERKELKSGHIGKVPVQWRIAPTNGLTYFRAVNSLKDLPDELRLYLPLFTEAILRIGTRRKSMEQLEDEIKLKTGGIRASTHVSTNHSNLEVTEEGLVYSGFCLDQNVPEMLELLKTILLETNFHAISKIRTLVQGIASGFVNSLAESGHAFARTFAAAHLTPAARINEVHSGMTQVRLISNLAAKEIYNDVLIKLREIAQFAARRNGLRVAITCSTSSASANETAVTKFIESLPVAETPVADTPLFDFETPARAFFPMPYQVSYGALCLRTVPYTHKDGASLQILSQLLTHKHLHHEIREKGGAYGGGAFHRGAGGVFGFYSYRDPNILNSIKVMEQAGEFALNKNWTERDLDDAKLSVFQGIDAPTSISDEGMVYFLDGITDDMRQRRREQLLDVQINDVRGAAQKYLVDQIRSQDTALAVLGEASGWVDDKWDVYPLSLDLEGEKTTVEKIKL